MSCSPGQRYHGREQRPTLEVASLRVASKWEEMIPIPNSINPQILGATNSIRIRLVGGMLLA